MNIAEILNGGLLVGLPLAALAGLVSFLSPCVLPLIPGYLGVLGGVDTRSSGDRPASRRLLLAVSLFILGFTVVFVVVNIIAGAAGWWLIRNMDLITRISGLVLIVMGLIFVGNVQFAQRTVKLRWTPKAGLAGAPILGVIFAIGWTPCIGPTLALVLAMSANQASLGQSIVFAIAYCFGLGIPFLLITFGFTWMNSALSFVRHNIRIINLIGGVALALVGILMVTGLWGRWLSELQAVISGVPAFI